MKINKLNIKDSQVNFADHIEKIVYSESIGINDEQFGKLISSIKTLPKEKLLKLQQLTLELNQANSDDESKTTSLKIKEFLVRNGVSIAHSLSASGIIELGKLMLSG